MDQATIARQSCNNFHRVDKFKEHRRNNPKVQLGSRVLLTILKEKEQSKQLKIVRDKH